MKYLLIAMNDDGTAQMTICDTPEQRDAETLKAIFGEIEASHKEQHESELNTLREDSYLHFEGDPSIYWYQGEIATP